MHVMNDCAATLGSRFNLMFDPHGRRVLQSACGGFRELPLELRAGVRLRDGRLWLLPFADGGETFPHLEQFTTLTTIEYRGLHPGVGIEFGMKVRAPFYPRDAWLSTAPVYYVDLSVRRLHGWRRRSCETPLETGEVVFALAGDGVEFDATQSGFCYTFSSGREPRPAEPESEGSKPVRAVPVRCSVHCPAAGGVGTSELRKDFDLSGGEPATLSFLWSCWTQEPVLEVKGERFRFKYHEFFPSEERLLAWAQERRAEVEEHCAFLDSLFADWSLGRATSHLSALALHSFLANTWWTTRKGGKDWFSVWEGSCHFHSSVDVQYNGALLYFALWPELLDMLLEEWSEFEVDGRQSLGKQAKGTSFLCRDMGAGRTAGQQAYPHHMEVEVNADYLLLMAARTFFRGDLQLARRHMPLCRRLADFIVQSDTTGSGFPDRGTANTIDDASPALQFGKEQTYLAVKAQAALWALAELEGALSGEKESRAEHWKAFASKGVKTLNEKGWLGDHYAVTLERSTEGLVDPRTGDPLPEGELEGWDDYSIYTANGLLYLLLANIKMPRWKLGRFAQDIEAAAAATSTPYGSRHGARGEQAVWISQNLWRDYVAAYLGVDMLNNVEAYWDYQVLTGDNLDASLYFDSTPQNDRCFHPRGAAVFGAALSACGLRLNRIEGELHLGPVCSTLRVPLLPLVDWQKMRAPWLIVRCRDGVALAEITERDLLGDLAVRVTGAELETA